MRFLGFAESHLSGELLSAAAEKPSSSLSTASWMAPESTADDAAGTKADAGTARHAKRTCQDFEGYDAEGPHVCRRMERQPFFSVPFCFDRLRRIVCPGRMPNRGLPLRRCVLQIDQLPRKLVRKPHNVLGREISVGDPVGVDVLESFQYLESART